MEDKTNLSSTSKRRGARGMNWTDKETRVMLEVATDLHINKLMDSSRYRHIDIYKSLQNKLQERGLKKTHEQIKIKFKRLKTSYINCKRTNAVSGEKKNDIPFYEELDLLFGSRPMVDNSLDGVDTIILSEIPTAGEEDLNNIDPNVVVVQADIHCDADPVEGISDQSVIEDLVDSPLPGTSRESQSESSRKRKMKGEGGGRHSNSTIMQNLANILKKNSEELLNKVTKENENFIKSQMKKQREWDMEIAKMTIRSQEKQTNKLINALLGLKHSTKRADNIENLPVSSDEDISLNNDSSEESDFC